LITGSIPPILDSAQIEFLETHDVSAGDLEEFISEATKFFASSRRNQILGLDTLPVREAIMGCNHFIDNLIMQHGLGGLNILEHDYRYYSRLDPQIKYARVGELVAERPLLIAAPVPGYLDLHPQWQTILSECREKMIPVHIDGCWMGSAQGITLDLSDPVIKSVAFSLSKGLGLSWNRVGLRYSREQVATDSITIYNQHNMIPNVLMSVGIQAMQQFNYDYLWDTYGDRYHQICRELKLRPGKIIQAAQSIDRKTIFGLKNYF
jgi:hypothetical protein